jgi:hypothetical protein
MYVCACSGVQQHNTQFGDPTQDAYFDYQYGSQGYQQAPGSRGKRAGSGAGVAGGAPSQGGRSKAPALPQGYGGPVAAPGMLPAGGPASVGVDRRAQLPKDPAVAAAYGQAPSPQQMAAAGQPQVAMPQGAPTPKDLQAQQQQQQKKQQNPNPAVHGGQPAGFGPMPGAVAGGFPGMGQPPMQGQRNAAAPNSNPRKQNAGGQPGGNGNGAPAGFQQPSAGFKPGGGGSGGSGCARGGSMKGQGGGGGGYQKAPQMGSGVYPSQPITKAMQQQTPANFAPPYAMGYAASPYQHCTCGSLRLIMTARKLAR